MDEASLKTLSNDIIRSHGEPGNSDIQTNVLMRCMQVLSLDALADEVHLFCNLRLQPIAGHALIMFSFPGQMNTHSIVVKERMVRSLSRCPECIRGFERCLSQMRLRFVLVRRIPVAQVDQFIAIITVWQLERLRKTLQEATSDAQSVSNAFLECISNPGILRKDTTILSLLSSKLATVDQLPNYITPALIYLLVEGEENAQLLISRLTDSLGPSLLHLDPQVVDEFNFQSYRLQDARFFSADRSRRFWEMTSLMLDKCPPSEFTKLLKPADLEEMSSHIQLRFLPLVGVLFKNMMAGLDKPLPVLLSVLKKLLNLYPQSFWDIAKGYHFSQILDSVIVNTNFHRLLHEAATNTASQYSLIDLLDWSVAFVSSLTGSQKQTAAIKLTDFLVQLETTETLISDFYSVRVLESCFSLEGITANKSSVSLLKMRDARLCVSKHASHFILLARKTSEIELKAMHLICMSLKYDILVAANNSAMLERKEYPTFSDTKTALWATLLSVPFSDRLVSNLLKCFESVLLMVIFKEKKNAELSKELDASIKIHNRETLALCSNICAVLDKISLADPEQLLKVLEEKKGIASLWSSICCPQTSQSALNIISQVFDSEGRFEAISELLKNLLPNLIAINSAVVNITSMKIFEPCPRVMRILMDVIKVLTDPLNGIMSTNATLSQSCQMDIKSFWNTCWSFLIMVYQTTLTWAGMYHLGDLVEFTRDTLDTSHLLLDSYRTLCEIFPDDEEQKVSLFNVFMNAFNHVIVWLRLGDPSLLTSCLNLVFKGFDLAKDLNVNVDKSFIITFAKYGAKAKRFNNKLTELQRLEVIAKASEFDSNLVQFVIDEAARDRKGTPPATSTATSNTPVTPGATYAYQSRKQMPKQLTLSRFGVVTKEAPVAPPPPKPFKSTNLEAIRNELKSNRTPLSASINPAPPRPAGFNHKAQPVVGRSLNQLKQRRTESDSSDDDADGDVDVSDLFLDSKKKSKITELDIHGRPLIKMAAAKKVDTKRLEEERMRMRLNVNLKPLYSTILKWNYTSNSETPTDDDSIYHPIKDKYTNARDYVNMIEPLLMLECWQGIQSSRVTGQELPFELLIGSRTTCDGFFDVYTSIKKADLASRRIGDTDLLVLGFTQDKDIKDPKDIAKYLKCTNTQTCLAKVREVKFVNPDFSDLTLRVYPQGSMMGLLTPKSVIVAMKVMQMTTVEREYSSLKGLQYYDLCDKIVKAEPAVPLEISDARAKELCKTFNVNISQAKAIVGSHLNEGFSLIQGPPGTGKTKTILGIVGHFLSKSAKVNAIEEPTSGLKSTTPEESTGPKVLICAPSNAAIDELVVRLKSGVFNVAGKSFTPKIVRLGRSDAMNPVVRDVGLEELVERLLQARTNDVAIDPSLRLQHNECIAERDHLRKELKNENLKDEEIVSLEAQLREVSKKRSELGKKLDEQREKASIAHRTREIEKRQAQAKVLTEAQVICSTLSGSAHDFLLSMSMKFDQVIIDEACQCVELSAIIPLRYGCKKCIMVGDPNQLPPTVLSQAAASYKYEQSLFVRMQRNNPDSVYLLDVQYRMHPDISKFPSSQFYHSRLSDGEGMFEKNDRPWHKDYPLTPYHFFDIVSKHQQSEQTKSFFNAQEAKVALELVEKLMNILPDNKFKGRIGIISPYKEQIRTLRDVFQRKWGSTILNEIDFNTVDGFQGQEKEIIIMSCVRASSGGSVGFLSDIRRMNVALTRARTTLWILGNKQSLKRDKIWSKLISDAEIRNCVSSAQPGFLKNSSSISGPLMHSEKTKIEDSSNKKSPAASNKAKDSVKPYAASEIQRTKRKELDSDLFNHKNGETSHQNKKRVSDRDTNGENNSTTSHKPTLSIRDDGTSSSGEHKPKKFKSKVYIHNAASDKGNENTSTSYNYNQADRNSSRLTLISSSPTQTPPKLPAKPTLDVKPVANKVGYYKPPNNGGKNSSIFIRRPRPQGRP